MAQDDETADNLIKALPALAPTIDGYAESTWDSAGEYQGEITDGPRFTVNALINQSYIYFLVTIQIDNHASNEYTALLRSNTTNYESKDLVDINRVNRDNTTADAHLVSVDAGYNVDNSQNMTGKMAFYPDPAVHNWTIYEFQVPIASNDSDDVNWLIGKTYAAKLGFGNGDAGNYDGMQISGDFLVQVGAAEGEGNVDLGEFEFDWNIFLYVIFGVIFAIYGILAFMLFQSRVAAPVEKESAGERKIPEEMEPDEEKTTGKETNNSQEGKK